MARLYPHKTRGWQLLYTVYFPEGSEKRKFRYFKNKLKGQDALQDVEKLEHRSLKGTLTQEDLLYFLRCKYLSKTEADQLLGAAVIPPTLGQLAGQFLARSKTECRPRVHASNAVRVGHLLSFFGDVSANAITMDSIEDYRRDRLKTVSAATVNKEIIKLGQLLDIALEKNAIQENPARRIRRLRDARERKPRSLTKDEIEKLQGFARNERHLFNGYAYEVLMAYLYTGMRRSELTWLEWEDIDFDKRRITVQAKIEKDGFRPKPGSARVIGLSKKLANIFKGLPRGGRFVFGGDRPLMAADGVGHAFKKLVRRAGLPESITLHSLRHSYITHLMEAGVNPRRVQELAGHQDMSTTWRYSHALPSDGVAEDLLDF